MITVPKLNYANIRGKSKQSSTSNNPNNLNNDNSEQKIQNNSSDLFSHMNQDNLKYIQNQIKQKNRKISQVIRKKREEDEEEGDGQENGYEGGRRGEERQGQGQMRDLRDGMYSLPLKIQKIEEKQSRYEETQREMVDPMYNSRHSKIGKVKTHGQQVTLDLPHDDQSIGPSKKVSQQGQTNKLSYYDLLSQAKSKRVPSLQAYYQEEQAKINKQSGEFLNFLSIYIQDLNNKGRSEKEKERKKFAKLKGRSDGEGGKARERDIQRQKERQRERQRERERQRQRQVNAESATISVSASERQILKHSLAQQKSRNQNLAKIIEQHHQKQTDHKKRIQKLQQFVIELAQQLQQVNLQLKSQKKSSARSRKQLSENRHHQHLNIFQSDNSSVSNHPNQPQHQPQPQKHFTNSYLNLYPNSHMQSYLQPQNLNDQPLHRAYQSSHRKNHTSFSLITTTNNNMNNNMNNLENNGKYIHHVSRNSRKVYVNLNDEDTHELEKQYEEFLKTGDCFLKDKSRRRDRKDMYN